MPANPIAATIVSLVEKHLGTSFDLVTDTALVNAVNEYLKEVFGTRATGTPLPRRESTG